MADAMNSEFRDRLFERRTVPLEALFGEDGTGPTVKGIEALVQADLILGCDTGTGRHVLLFGKDALGRLLPPGDSELVDGLWIDMDQDSEDLEVLLQYITGVKGGHDYPPAQDDTPVIRSDYNGPILWHYTIAVKLLGGILEQGLLRFSTIGLSPGEKPAVWFSSNQHWEASATKGTIDRETGRPRDMS